MFKEALGRDKRWTEGDVEEGELGWPTPAAERDAVMQDDAPSHLFWMAVARELLPLAAGEGDVEAVVATALWVMM